jgi:hypothetical protein
MAASLGSRRHLHPFLDQLHDQQISLGAPALETIRQNSLAAILRDIPGLRMPHHGPPRYPDVEPLTVAGEPASEQLLLERR